MIGLIGALFLMGIVVGCSTLTRLGDKWGRRPIYLLGLVMHMFFMVGILFTTSKLLAYGLLFIFGMSITARYYVGYTYNLEMQPKSHHVLVSTSMFLFESVIYFFICIYFSFISKNWKILQIPNLVFCIMGIIFMLWMPESPKFLIANKRFTEARKVFTWIGLKNGLELDVIQERLAKIEFEDEKYVNKGKQNTQAQ
jgi:MFS family permease